MIDFDTYIKMGEPGGKERAEAWKTAIGLQAVDGLKTSEYLNETAAKHIEGDITIEQVKELIDTYYQSRTARTPEDDEKEEADKAAANITKIINEPSFTFSLYGLTSIHKRIFTGIFKHAGILRDYEISKKEWVLDGASVSYGFAFELKDALSHDIQRERDFKYTGMDMPEIVKHIAQFTSDIWQIHPFCEGNTRTTAVFIIKYLRSLGFDVNNSTFEKNSWYFRNALVRANYQNLQKGIYKETIHLERFFRNLLMGEENVLMNRHLHIKAKELLDGINSLGSDTVINAIKLTGFDRIVKNGFSDYQEPPIPPVKVIYDIVDLVYRCINFFNERNITETGFAVNGGKRTLVSFGEGDYLSKTELIDLKVSKTIFSSAWSLQVLMYYIMGLHNNELKFNSIDYIGIYNALKNEFYKIYAQLTGRDIPLEPGFCRGGVFFR